MGFASPAADYVERQLTPEILCNMGADSRVLETDMGFAVIEPVVMKTPGRCVADFVRRTHTVCQADGTIAHNRRRRSDRRVCAGRS